jgi:SWI/SNF-related matrix-associated actin-dependent regulator 1 of chromatin subfamily A
VSLIKRLKKALRTKPLQYQYTGIKFIERKGGRVLIGDDMGLGKTLEALGWIGIHPEQRPVVIVTPASAKYNWEEQIKEHTRELFPQVLSGRKPTPVKSDILIINYDIIHWWKQALIKLKPAVLVFDEFHKLKTRNTRRTKACRELSRKVKHIMPLSGTPIVNRPVEFFPILNILFPKKFPSFWKYAFRYCDPVPGWKGRSWNFTGASNLEELHEKIKPFFLRRLKINVMKELPPKRRSIIPVDISNRSEYRHAKEDFIQWYRTKAGTAKAKRARKAQALVRIGQLKQLTAEGKYKNACEWIDDFLETTDEKLVVFVYHRAIFDLLTKKYKSISAIGGKSGEQRQKEVKKFQTNPKCRLFLGTIGADKESITLTASSTVLFLELGWTPSEHDQAEDRVNRIGQTDNKISVYYMLGKNTIDQYVWDVIEKKRKIIDQVVDGKNESDNRLLLDRIIDSLKGEKE